MMNEELAHLVWTLRKAYNLNASIVSFKGNLQVLSLC